MILRARAFLVKHSTAPRRTSVDGLAWCAECRRAVDRGWPHAESCAVGYVEDKEREKRWAA